jgi:hypothetical protein
VGDSGGQGAGGSAGTTGGGQGAGGSAGAAGSGATMADVQAIFDERCTICHDASHFGVPSYPALPLTAGASHASLVGQPAHEPCGGTLVVPFDPAQSYLIHKLSDAPPCEGVRMPAPFEIQLMFPLTEQQMAVIRSWISAGAPP